ncbi:radical SAM protein [Petroclostridium sp. X23]|uniref:elongator complex protein 3 n=1 Tax=Petroclostridium sp. X23 TaxID=3045146 RepID=UPI0024ADC4F4|nr:radical SAM protein [Petroclostridium sp. X23]WHH59416.1 radical SAM protein [Petroclostridium sp. X23]
MHKKNYIIPIFVPHKGCPHDCIFCNQKKITGSRDDINAATVESIINKYLDTIPRKDAVIEVAFYGGSFTGIPQETQIELLLAAKRFKDQDRIQGIRLSTRPDYIDEHIVELLKQMGVTTIELGVQSMDAEVLKLSYRGHSCEDVVRAVSIIKQKGFTLGLQMMVGLPGDSEQTIQRTADEIIALKPDIVRIYPTLVVKETALEKLYYQGKYKPFGLDAAVKICKELLVKFEMAGIQVIRIGLQPTDTMQEGKDIIAGPFHPAFRELVESQLRLDMIKFAANQFTEITGGLQLEVHPKALSEVVGVKKNNINHLKQYLKIDTIHIIQNADLMRDEIIVNKEKTSIKVSKKIFYNSLKPIK